MNLETKSHFGRCHCGNLEVIFESKLSPDRLSVRACSCSFCSRHGAHTTTDPDGSVQIIIHHPDQLIRYRFGLKTADFLVCKQCGVYVAAVFELNDCQYATVNINTFAAPERFTREPARVTYDGETAAERRARRKARWTPVIARR
jgi:hypothetical protein